MASLSYVVIAAVLASVMADLPTHDQLRTMFKAAREACKNETRECQDFCQITNLGILDKDGGGSYVESEAIKAMAIMVHEGILNQEQVNKIAKTCNSGNEREYKDRMRARSAGVPVH
ncbi:uncharacterized protein LOC134803501 isoform X2 [Cydia splendana]|uniref:uncharacterized protein LOC134803501 isoform X2 n=1 Tax=Cydia splendana TaxID=1100963 RepID=UPI00300D6DF8